MNSSQDFNGQQNGNFPNQNIGRFEYGISNQKANEDRNRFHSKLAEKSGTNSSTSLYDSGFSHGSDQKNMIFSLRSEIYNLKS